MACVENIPPGHPDSEMEEGEIVDEFDDISSDEELLLRQRLHILETYNNVLEKKKAKDISTPGKKVKSDSLLRDLSDISTSDFEDSNLHRNTNNKQLKTHKRRRRIDPLSFKVTTKIKEKKKVHKRNKLQIKIVSESSEESDDEYRNKRRKLANAVSVHKDKNDTSSLSARLKKMLYGPKITEPPKTVEKEHVKVIETKKDDNEKPTVPIVFPSPIGSPISDENSNVGEELDKALQENLEKPSNDCELIDLCEDSTADNSGENKNKDHHAIQLQESAEIDEPTANVVNEDSDEDLELLRKHALETKSSKTKAQEKEITNETDNLIIPEDDDNYTAELRLICLKSAYLKKAIEIKRRQKLKKRLSQSSVLQDDFVLEQDELLNKVDSQNNTDIESVDMEIGSDGDEKLKELGSNKNLGMIEDVAMNLVNNNLAKIKEDELEEDEDLLRAKLLTSLSKNLPNLMDTSILDGLEDITSDSAVTEDAKQVSRNEKNKQTIKIPEPKKLIIQLGGSDSEGEHEATKNLTKMHIKQQNDFEQQLDMFLKSTRKKVENQIPNILEPPVNASEKFVPKSVKHLPKSEQIEYKNLVKRMAELEKIKQARQSGLNLAKSAQIKDTLKPRNVTVDSNITTANSNAEEQIAVSRKKIAEESANMIRLREEATKLSQKYKIVANELKNIATAIALNKKQQKSAQVRLSKIRSQHQMLLKSSTYSHSQKNGFVPSQNRAPNKSIATTKLQKENNPKKEEIFNPQLLKSVKVSVVNDLNEVTVPKPRLSVQVDVSNNKKVVTVPKDRDITESSKELRVNEVERSEINVEAEITVANHHELDNEVAMRLGHETSSRVEKLRISEVDDYKSPLQSLETANWAADPNAFLCPFEVGGNCKDPDCKYLHPKTPVQ